MSDVRFAMAAAGCTNVSVMIVGEAGVGKEALARRIHAESTRADHPFTVINCGACRGSLAESAWLGYPHDPNDRDESDGGTVFLDGVGELSSRMQAALWWSPRLVRFT